MFRVRLIITTDQVFLMGWFGHPAYQVGLGHWLSVNTISKVCVKINKFGDFELFSDDDGGVGYHFGQSHDAAIVFLDRVIDSSGLLDAALVNGERRKWAWKLSLDPLSAQSKKRRVLYGYKGHIPFLFRARGRVDSLDLLNVRKNRSTIHYRSLNGRRKRKIKLRKFTPPSQQPILIRGSYGRDGFGFVANDKFHVVSNRGRKDLTEISIPEGGSVLVGEFNGEDGDEVITFTEGKITFTDRESKRLSDKSVKPLHSTASKYKTEDISPTIAATSTPTLFPTSTPMPTSSFTVTSTQTITPTVVLSPTPTLTFTPIQMWTVQPTYTAAPNYTSFPP